MRNKIIILSVFWGILLVGCVDNQEVRDILSDFEKQHIDDGREEIFDISIQSVARQTFVLKGDIESESLKTSLLDTFRHEGFIIQDSIKVLPDDVPYHFGLVALSVANLRAEPSHRSEMVSQALMGTPVRILKESGGWLYIQTPDKYLSWAEKVAIKGMEKEEMEEWRHSNRLIVTKPFSFVSDDSTGNHVSNIVAGCILQHTASDEDDYLVVLPGGETGKVRINEVAPFTKWNNNRNLNIDSIGETALKMLGIPYLWGGTSFNGMDCSGFTKTVYFLNGKILARDASLQVKHGLKVETGKGWENYEKGDLLFFAPHETSNRITHVGIYLSDSEFIHAAGKVKINSLDSARSNYSAYRDRTLSEVRRVIGSNNDKGIVPVVEHPWY